MTFPGEPTAPVDDRARPLDPRWIQVERVTGAITSAVLAGAAMVGVAIPVAIGALGFPLALLLPAIWLGFCLILAVLALWTPAIRYRHIDYRVSGERIQIRRGVIWRSVTSVPRNRVQHTDVSQGPIERMFELSTLIIYIAGTQHASVHLSGLDRDTAMRIRDHLLVGGEDDAV